MKGVTIGHNSLLRTTTIYYSSRKSNLEKRKRSKSNKKATVGVWVGLSAYTWCSGPEARSLAWPKIDINTI
jgi:hypothetical protein